MLDVQRLSVDGDGVADLHWPVPRDEVATWRKDLFRELAGLFHVTGEGHGRSTDGTEDSDTEALRVAVPYLAQDLLSLHQAHELHRRLGEHGLEPVGLGEGRYLKAARAGRALDALPLLEVLERGPSTGRRWVPGRLREARWTLSINGPTWRALARFDPARDVAVPSNEPLVRRHARAVPETVRYTPYGRWFDLDGVPTGAPGGVGRGGRGRGRADEEQDPPDLVDDLREAVAAALPGDLPKAVEDYLERRTAPVADRIGRLVEDLIRRSDLPGRLWTGTGGNVWPRLLRRAVTRGGGTVVGHDHSVGGGLYRYNAYEVVEYADCDTFVTANRLHARNLEASFDPSLFAGERRPAIEAVPDPDGGGVLRPARAPPDGIRTVMHAFDFYTGERLYNQLVMPDPVAVDWQARLYRHLGDWGYRVLLKPHPVSADQIPDAYVTEHPLGTGFALALSTGRPVIYLDFGMADWLPDVRDRIEARCAVVEGRFDERGRAHVDWDELRAAFDAAAERTDDRFVRDCVPLHVQRRLQ